MKPEHNEVIEKVFCEVLEKFAFMFVEPAERNDLSLADETFLMADMRFSGEINGTLKLAVPGELSLEIAANILGIDPEQIEDDERAKDAIREVLNVTCGHLMTEISGDKPVFNLSVPNVEYLPHAKWDLLLQEPGTIGFLIEDRPAALMFHVEDDA